MIIRYEAYIGVFPRSCISEHFDHGNDYYQLWLDPSMTFSSALFTGPDTLEVQAARFEAVCQKVRQSNNDHVLEIGCGWGGNC